MIKDHKNEMLEMRKMLMTDREIAERFGCSKQYVLMVLGARGKEFSRVELTRKIVDSTDLSNHSLDTISAKPGVAKVWVSELRKRHHALRRPGSRAHAGHAGEKVVSEFLTGKGIKHKLQPLQDRFDIVLENGKTIDVKTATVPTPNCCCAGPLFRFALDLKSRRIAPDFFALYIAPHSEIFFVPSSFYKSGLQCCGIIWPPAGRTADKYLPFRGNLKLLLE